MAQTQRGFQFALTWLVMAALCGLIGFAIVYHYATYDRPIQNFAIVLDAGSTQTRSSLFTITYSAPKLSEWFVKDEEKSIPLNRLIQIKQVSSCTNGGPLSALQSDMGARQLVDKCLGKFAQHIKKLDFMAASSNGNENDDDLLSLDSAEVSDQLAIMNHQVNSVTHVLLGATAGMRALAKLNSTRALEKIHWIDKALNDSRNQIADSPFVNKGYVGIIEGSEEAAFGWVSVNFICENLLASVAKEPQIDRLNSHEAEPKYEHITGDKGQGVEEHKIETINSVGTIELGGASAQMAYQVPLKLPEAHIQNSSFEGQLLRLYNDDYRLATRSDLCLGMSQAVLRNNYIMLREYYTNNSNLDSTTIEMENPCLQRAARVSLTGQEIGGILRGACLASSKTDLIGAHIKEYLSSRKIIRFIGTGDTRRCDKLLNNLLQPQLCRRYFSICPQNTNTQPPPAHMSFVTISGYNKALLPLNLTKITLEDNKIETRSNEQLISEKLGGYSIDYAEFVEKTRDFCAIDISEFPTRFPKMRSSFQSITCMQLQYIAKLLTEFYRFDPTTSWLQIKFLLFPVATKPDIMSTKTLRTKHDDKNDIGWTLGLVLNATSSQDSGDSQQDDVYYHHGASIMFILRTTLLLMFACVLLAVAIVVFTVVSVKYHNHQQRRRNSRYLNPPPSYGASDSIVASGAPQSGSIQAS